jgi:O-acetylserine/cysteine efflux transporter
MTSPHLLLVLAINIVWGLTQVAAKYSVGYMPPILFIALRFALVLALLWPFLRWVPGQMLAILAVGLLGGMINFALGIWGVALSNASLSAVLGQLNAPFATVLSIVFLNEQVGWRRWTGISLAFAGVAFLSFDPEVLRYALGAALTVLGALAISVAQVLMRRLTVSTLNLQAWIAAISAPGLIVCSLGVEHGQWSAIVHAPWSVWGVIVYLAVGASLIGHGGMYYLLRRYDVALVTTFLMLSPVLGVLAGVIMLHEPMTWRILVGSGLTLIGVFIIAARQRRSQLAAVIPASALAEPAPQFAAEGWPHPAPAEATHAGIARRPGPG